MMKTEAELCQLLDDLYLYQDLHPGNPFTAGMASILSYALGKPDRCGVHGCREDHDAIRDSGVAMIQKRATDERQKRITEARAQRQ
jgi:hypothetical protein